MGKDHLTPPLCLGMGSSSGSNLRFLLQNQDGFEIRAIFSDRICPLREISSDFEIDWLFLDSQDACGSHPGIKKTLELREYQLRCRQFEEDVLTLIKKYQRENQCEFDSILLAGYFRILRGPLLKTFSNRILNVHPGDLRVCGGDGERLFVGMNAVLKAILCGVPETYSTVHLVNEEVDGGEILGVSEPNPVLLEPDLQRFVEWVSKDRVGSLHRINSKGLTKTLSELEKETPLELQKLRDFSQRHQEKQKKTCDWPTYLQVVKERTERNAEIEKSMHSHS